MSKLREDGLEANGQTEAERCLAAHPRCAVILQQLRGRSTCATMAIPEIRVCEYGLRAVMMDGSHAGETVIRNFANRKRQRDKRLRPTGRRDELDLKCLRGIDRQMRLADHERALRCHSPQFRVDGTDMRFPDTASALVK